MSAYSKVANGRRRVRAGLWIGGCRTRRLAGSKADSAPQKFACALWLGVRRPLTNSTARLAAPVRPWDRSLTDLDHAEPELNAREKGVNHAV